MNGALYDELVTHRVFGIPRNDRPWVLLFAKDGIDSTRSMTQFQHAAHHMNGEVRFAWVDTWKEELLASSFAVKELPATYLIKDGMVYHYRDFQYSENIQKYIREEGYLKSTYSFKQPGRFFIPQLYLYTYPVKELRRLYRIHLENHVNSFIRAR